MAMDFVEYKLLTIPRTLYNFEYQTYHTEVYNTVGH